MSSNSCSALYVSTLSTAAEGDDSHFRDYVGPTVSKGSDSLGNLLENLSFNSGARLRVLPSTETVLSAPYFFHYPRSRTADRDVPC